MKKKAQKEPAKKPEKMNLTQEERKLILKA